MNTKTILLIVAILGATITPILILLATTNSSNSNQTSQANISPSPTPTDRELLPIPIHPELPRVPPGAYAFGHIWHWDGSRWNHKSPVDIEPITDIWGTENTLFAVGWEEIWQFHHGAWVKENYRGPRLSGVWGSSARDVYAVGGKAILYNSGNGQWLRQSSPVSAGLSDIWGRSADDIFVVGSEGTILHSQGGGKWQTQVSNVSVSLESIWGDEENIYVVGENGTILHSTQNGVWTQENVETDEDFASVWGTGYGEVYAVTRYGSIFYSSGDGQWQLQKRVGEQLSNVWGLSPNQIYVGDLKG